MERQCIRSLWYLYDDQIVGALVRVILGEFDAQSSSLHADRGVALGIESGGSAQHLGGNLVFLERDSGVIERVFREVPQQFAQRFRGVQAMTFNKFIYLLEALRPTDRESVRDSHITGGNGAAYLTAVLALYTCNGIKPSETYAQ